MNFIYSAVLSVIVTFMFTLTRLEPIEILLASIIASVTIDSVCRVLLRSVKYDIEDYGYILVGILLGSISSTILFTTDMLKAT